MFNRHRFNLWPPVEPSSTLRELAQCHKQIYIAHREQGFSATEALELTVLVVQTSMQDWGMDE